jgi:hypothetical protein
VGRPCLARARARRRRAATVAVTLGLTFVLFVASARPARAAPDADLVAGLAAADGADVVSIDLPAPAGAPHVRAATTVRAAPATIVGVLADPARFASMLPSLVRSQVVGQRGDARVVAWELEVPLFNLSGTLELRARPDGVELTLLDGDFSPGRVAFATAARAGGGATLTVDARLDVRRSSWFLRRVMARSRWGEPAALAAATWVVLRAAALRAEHARDAVASRPTAPFVWPYAGVPDGGVLARAPLGALAARGATAIVAAAPSGRFVGAAVAVPTREPHAALDARLADTRTWRAFPGWRVVRPMPPTAQRPATVVVEDSIPFVDLDATWQARPLAHARAWTAVEGAARGAWFGWQVADVPAVGTEAILSLAPRLEQTGSIPRRLIDAEPLLEHGLALALALVDALGATHGGDQ